MNVYTMQATIALSPHDSFLLHTCVSLLKVECWGRNYYGQLGNGESSTTIATQPVSAIGLPAGNITSISVGYQYTCAVVDGRDRRDGAYANSSAWCWGYNNNGQLGDGTVSTRYLPVKVKNLAANVTQIVAGWYATCAVLAEGSVHCWGYNNYGYRGDGSSNLYVGSSTDALLPQRVQGLGVEIHYDENHGTVRKETDVQVTQIAMGEYHVLALTSTGKVYSWGYNYYGQCMFAHTLATSNTSVIATTATTDANIVMIPTTTATTAADAANAAIAAIATTTTITAPLPSASQWATKPLQAEPSLWRPRLSPTSTS